MWLDSKRLLRANIVLCSLNISFGNLKEKWKTINRVFGSFTSVLHMSKVKVKQLCSRTLVPSETTLIPVGVNGFWETRCELDKEGKEWHHILCKVNVHQLPPKTDLDIGFLVLNKENYILWANNRPNIALVLIPRLISGVISFEVPKSDTYYFIVSNKHSTFTTKTVTVGIDEVWQEEREIEVPVAEKVVERIAVRPKVPEKVGILKRIWRRLRSQLFGLILAFFIIQVTCFLFTSMIVHIAREVFDVSLSDATTLYAAMVGGGLILFGIVYSKVTGKPLSRAA